VVEAISADAVIAASERSGVEAWTIGSIAAGEGVRYL